MSESENRTTVVDFERLKAQYQLPQSTSTKDQPTQPDGPSHSPSGLPSKGPKKRNASPLKEPSRKVVKGPPKALGLFQALQSGGGSKTLIVRDESPWDTFELSFSCKLAGTVAIAAHRSRPSRVIAIRQYSAGDVETMLQRFRHIQHENIMCSSECYRHNCSLYAVVDDLPLTLEHLGSRAVCPNEIQLGSIMRQILDGLSCLLAARLEHRALTCSNILFGLDGTIKIGSYILLYLQDPADVAIAGLESCVNCLPNQVQAPSIQALSTITMELMQTYDKNDGVVGVDDLDRWPVDSDAVGFLSTVSSTVAIEALKQHPLVNKPNRHRGQLVCLARRAAVSARTFYTFKT